MILVLGIIIVITNQYFFFNAELFIILAFFSLCYVVYTTLGNLVDQELQARADKIKKSYVDLVKKKKIYSSLSQKIIEIKKSYLCNVNDIYISYFEKYKNLFFEIQRLDSIDLDKNTETKMLVYFAKVVSEKIKI